MPATESNFRDAYDGPTDEERDALVWEHVGDAFSEPVTDSDDMADYAPTQVVAEVFRRAGYDGIHYKSKLVNFESFQPPSSPERAQEFREATLKDGRNIALFDRDWAEFKNSKLHRFAINGRETFDFIPVNEPFFALIQFPTELDRYDPGAVTRTDRISKSQ